jgi:Zn-dependent protease
VKKYFRIKNTRVFGAPVFVHHSVLWCAGIYLLLSLGEPVRALLTVASYFAIIVVHEIGHAAVASRLRCRVESLQIYPFHGLCQFEDPYSEWEHVLISWGGVLAQCALALVALAVLAPFSGRQVPHVAQLGLVLVYFNLLIAAINLVPYAGLDGKLAWRIIPLLVTRYKTRTTVKKTISKAKRTK